MLQANQTFCEAGCTGGPERPERAGTKLPGLSWECLRCRSYSCSERDLVQRDEEASVSTATAIISPPEHLKQVWIVIRSHCRTVKLPGSGNVWGLNPEAPGASADEGRLTQATVAAGLLLRPQVLCGAVEGGHGPHALPATGHHVPTWRGRDKQTAVVRGAGDTAEIQQLRLRPAAMRRTRSSANELIKLSSMQPAGGRALVYWLDPAEAHLGFVCLSEDAGVTSSLIIACQILYAGSFTASKQSLQSKLLFTH